MRKILTLSAALILVLVSGIVVHSQVPIGTDTSSSYPSIVYNLSAMAENSDVVAKTTVNEVKKARWPSGSRPEEVITDEISGIQRPVEMNLTRVIKGNVSDEITVNLSGGKIDGFES